MDQPVERLKSLQNLAKYEDQILDAIAGTLHGALLFLSNPTRFLGEAGFVVGEGLHAELDGLPGVMKNSSGSYEDVRDGKGRAARWRVQIKSLGLKSGKLDQLGDAARQPGDPGDSRRRRHAGR